MISSFLFLFTVIFDDPFLVSFIFHLLIVVSQSNFACVVTWVQTFDFLTIFILHLFQIAFAIKDCQALSFFICFLQLVTMLFILHLQVFEVNFPFITIAFLKSSLPLELQILTTPYDQIHQNDLVFLVFLSLTLLSSFKEANVFYYDYFL